MMHPIVEQYTDELPKFRSNEPKPLVAIALKHFLTEYPKVKAPVIYRKQTKLSAADIEMRRKLDSEGRHMDEIGKHFGVSESYISRILSGDRRPSPPCHPFG